MNCAFGIVNIKVFNKALKTLSKIGRELFMEGDEKELTLRTTKSSLNVSAEFKFYKNFFKEYEMKKAGSNSEKIMCKLDIRLMLPVFKNIQHLEKQIDSCTMQFDNKSTFLIFEIELKYSCHILRKVPLCDGQFFYKSPVEYKFPNTITGSGALFNAILLQIQSTGGDVTFDVSPHEINVQNYTSTEEVKLDVLRSKHTLSVKTFDTYNVEEHSELTFVLDSFRACIKFADFIHVGVSMSFQKAGKPVKISFKDKDLVEGCFIFSTLQGQLDSDASFSSFAESEEFVCRYVRIQEDESLHMYSQLFMGDSQPVNKGSQPLSKDGLPVDNDSQSNTSTKEIFNGERKNSL